MSDTYEFDWDQFRKFRKRINEGRGSAGVLEIKAALIHAKGDEELALEVLSMIKACADD